MAQLFMHPLRDKRSGCDMSVGSAAEGIDPVEAAALQLQKRRRLHDLNVANSELAEHREMGIAKRSRQTGSTPAEDENIDIPMYSTRQMQQFEAAKNAEMERLREEAQRYVAGKEEEVAAKTAEMQALVEESAAQKQELGRLQNENGILKQGVRIQSAAVERVKGEAEARHASEREAFGRAALEAADHLRRLENANYALRVQLEQMAPSGNGSGQLPRWGEGY